MRGEHEFRVAPLAIPDPAQMPSLDALRQNESIEMFVQRAQSANPRFALTEAPPVPTIIAHIVFFGTVLGAYVASAYSQSRFEIRRTAL